MIIKNKVLGFAMLLAMLTACKKEAGEGGTSSIEGKVHAQHIQQNGSGTPFYDWNDYVPEERVYIIYGTDHPAYDNDTRTSYDGTYSFKYLQKGTYKIYAYTVDTAGWADFTFDHNRP